MYHTWVPQDVPEQPKRLECIIFNVEHGLCVFVKSPNGYGLLVDCGSRECFSPIKWIRQNYNRTIDKNTPGESRYKYYKGRQYAKCVISHLHADHFSDVGSFRHRKEDRPWLLLRDKKTVKLLEEKITEHEESGDERRAAILREFKEFSSEYTEEPKETPSWGFDFFESDQVPFQTAEDVSGSRDETMNNRSYIIGIGYAGKKILLPGDMMAEGWKKALERSKTEGILQGTNFFVAAHHGHESGFTQEIIDCSGRPDIFIISARSKDECIDDSAYSKRNAKGYQIDGESAKQYRVSTSNRGRSIKITIYESGSDRIELLELPDNLSKSQAANRDRKSQRSAVAWLRE